MKLYDTVTEVKVMADSILVVTVMCTIHSNNINNNSNHHVCNPVIKTEVAVELTY